jgi:adenylosuccinate lyase
MSNVASGLRVYPARIAGRVNAELPFMATEKLIVRAVERGGDRQAAHEVIRRHSMAAAAAMKEGAAANDLFDRLAREPEFGLSAEEIATAADPSQFIGRAPQQVDEFLSEVVEPLLAGSSHVLAEESEIRV